MRDQLEAFATRIPEPDGAVLEGDLIVPNDAPGLVVFAHGSGSSRRSPRNQIVARSLHARGLGTLLMDLLTPDEEAVDARTRHLRFDIGLLADRLVGAVDWLGGEPGIGTLPVGYFGASTGAAAALVAAARQPSRIAGVVSRGGRPDLAGDALSQVRAPTLLVVGELDEHVIELNRRAYEHLRVEKDLVIVPGASHLFGERGALEHVAAAAGDWFGRHLHVGTTTSPA